MRRFGTQGPVNPEQHYIVARTDEYEFVEILQFKCIKHNREFVQIGQWTATTKPCSDCGHRNENLSLSDRQWRCRECGSHHDRDINAAINILRETALGPSVEQM